MFLKSRAANSAAGAATTRDELLDQIERLVDVAIGAGVDRRSAASALEGAAERLRLADLMFRPIL